MTRYRLVSRLPGEVAAYIAGLVDGEGTVTLTRTHRNENRRLVVSIANNDLNLLKYVHGAVGTGRITSKRTYHQRHSPSFDYQITSRQALELVRPIFPYLRTYRRARAALALDQYLNVTPRNGKYTADSFKAKNLFASAFLAIKR
jgi:LAGLIDADG DNA endonuclease family protein